MGRDLFRHHVLEIGNKRALPQMSLRGCNSGGMPEVNGVLSPFGPVILVSIIVGYV